jgi:hypothetical protein
MPTVEPAVIEKIHPFSARLFMPYQPLTDVSLLLPTLTQLMRIWIR